MSECNGLTSMRHPCKLTSQHDGNCMTWLVASDGVHMLTPITLNRRRPPMGRLPLPPLYGPEADRIRATRGCFGGK